jgi:hypothetical protein
LVPDPFSEKQKGSPDDFSEDPVLRVTRS